MSVKKGTLEGTLTRGADLLPQAAKRNAQTRTFGRRPTALARPATALQPYSPRDCVRGLVVVRFTRGCVNAAVRELAVDLCS